MRRLPVVLSLALPGPGTTEARQEPVTSGEAIRPIRAKYAFERRGPEMSKGGPRLDQLAPDLNSIPTVPD